MNGDPIEQATEVAAATIWRIHGPDSTDEESAQMDGEEIAQALADAGLLPTEVEWGVSVDSGDMVMEVSGVREWVEREVQYYRADDSTATLVWRWFHFGPWQEVSGDDDA